MKKVKVSICGEELVLKADEDELYLQRIARYVETKMVELQMLAPHISDRMRFLLLAINLTDDYLKAEEDLAGLDVQYKACIEEIKQLRKENALLAERFAQASNANSNILPIQNN